MSMDWFTWRSLARTMRRSAGSMSPAASWTMSPRTTSSTGISEVTGVPCEERVTAVVVRTIAVSCSAARDERYSCQKRRHTLTSTMMLTVATPV